MRSEPRARTLLEVEASGLRAGGVGDPSLQAGVTASGSSSRTERDAVTVFEREAAGRIAPVESTLDSAAR